MTLMANDNHRALRLPGWLWDKYADVVGDLGRTSDLKIYMDWRSENPYAVLGPDVAAPYEFSTTLRIESERWELFMDTVGEGNCTADMRRYVWWRVQHPTTRLPGRRLGPLRREKRQPVPA
jgi:hypothetical protein